MGDYNFGVNEPPHKRWPVAWYNPAVLLRSAREMVSSGDLIRNFDRRELFTGTFNSVDLSQMATDGNFWWDFMSDSGDGGNATYTVARALQSPTLAVSLAEGVAATADIPGDLPSGKVLILGGDLAYPGASTEEYQYRFVEMWEAARPALDDPTRTVLAIPQNHDWFDNISTFHRHFIGDHANHFLDADAPQTRSYFATHLPQGWWLLGLDYALVGDLDRTQYEAFLSLIERELKPGDNVIMLYPEPYWTRALGDDARSGYPKRYQRLEAALLAHGVKIRMRLAGDLHHYVRETADAGADLDYVDMLVTCGSGGAFLHPTHAKRACETKVLDRQCDDGAITPDLEKRVRVGTENKADLTEGQRAYRDRICYPDEEKSKSLSYGNLFALFKPAAWSGVFPEHVDGGGLSRLWRSLCGADLGCVASGNVVFAFLLGALYWLAVYCNSFVFSASFHENGFVPASQVGHQALSTFLQMWYSALFFSPLAMGVHVVLLILCAAIAREDGWLSALTGVLHGLLHVLAAATLFWLCSKVTTNPFLKGFLLTISGMVVGGLLFGAYFSLMARLGCLANNAFSAIGHQGYKGFLRFRIDAEGNLHGYMIGTDKVPTRWKRNPGSNAQRPLWVETNPNAAPVWKVRDAFVLKR